MGLLKNVEEEMQKANSGNAAVTAPAVSAPAVSAPSVGAKTKTTGADKAQREKFKRSGEAIRAQMSDEEKTVEGSKSNTVTFKAALGNPAKKAKRRAGGQDLPSIQVVGYSLELGEACKVPHAPLKKNHEHLMDCEEVTWVDKNAGEVVNLNLFETGLFISQPQYAGTFTGGEPVKLDIKFSEKRKDVPLVALKKDAIKGSIKEVMIEVLEQKETAEGKTWVVRPGFEDFAGLISDRRSAGGRSSRAAAKQESHKDLAAAFRAYMAK